MSRLDSFIVEKGIARSREVAKKYIKDGNILVNSKVILKPSFSVLDSDNIIFTGQQEKYVGRGGLKLEYALNKFNINVKDFICIDIGASTGGFTDCLVQNGASKVYAVDVGKDQLDVSLKNNPKIISLEKTDIRLLTKDFFKDNIDFICTDVSFISLKKITKYAVNFLKDNGEMVFLIKPQFEVGIKNINKNGIVKDKKIHISLLKEMIEYFRSNNLSILNLTNSPIKGGSGNAEYLIHLKKNTEISNHLDLLNKIDNIVENAINLKGK